MPPSLYLIDGHALAYRTYFALTAASSGGGRWVTKLGEPTAGIYGFTSVLLRILEQERPDYIAVAFDTGKTFRDDIYPAYKGTRAKMPDDLRPQIERIRQVCDAFNIPRLEMEGYEADDVLGSVARSAARKGLGVKIITGDKDLLQLVTERIIVNLAGSKLSEAKDYTPEDVVKTLGVRPGQVIDYKGLVGDPSDNIPGVRGVGDKTAIKLLQIYANLDEIYAHLDDISPRVRAKLEEERESAYLSKKLATIITDIDISLDLDQARSNHYDPADVKKLFRELEFRSLIDRFEILVGLRQPAPAAGQQLTLFQPAVVSEEVDSGNGIDVHIVDSPGALDELVFHLGQADVIAFDTETTSTDPLKASLVGISLATKPGEGYYVPLGHQNATRSQLPLHTVVKALQPVFKDPTKKKIGHNLKYDVMMLKQTGMEVAPLFFDSMIAEWLVNPESHNLGLKNLAWTRLGVRMTTIEELIGKGKNQLTMDQVAIEAAAAYAATDAEVTLRLYPLLRTEMERLSTRKLFDELEMPLIDVLVEMEFNGIALDIPYFDEMSQELEKRLFEIEKDIYDSVGITFNINSTQQLSRILFEHLKLEPPGRRKKTASGLYSTSADVLEELRGAHPIVDWILEYRELAKLKSTYIDALPRQVNPQSGRIHTSFNQTGTVTGRIASSDPNLQNIPTRTELGRQVRDGLVAASGNYLLSVDYSQIELRIVAHMSGDKAMLNAFRAGQDIHAATAAAVYGLRLEDVTPEQRRNAKAINFGLIYGMSAFGLSRYTGLTLAESEDFVKAYFLQFPGVKHYLDQLCQQAAKQGYVETLLGRRRYFPGLKNQANANQRNREEREAINAPIQGSAADIIKIAMLRVRPSIHQASLHAKMLLQVHDELVFECPHDELLQTARLVQQVMEEAYPLSIPLLTEARWGTKWGSLQSLDAFSG